MAADSRRVLIVVSAYRPAIVADMQRARMLSWELPGTGWDVEVLTPAATELRQDIVEAGCGPFFPDGVPVHETGSLAPGLFRLLGSGTHAWRTLWPMYRRGCELLRSGRFDLVYLTTATFPFFALGPLWQRRFGVPYVLDFHDPWVAGAQGVAGHSTGLKRRALAWLDRRMELSAVGSAAGLVAVSPNYVAALADRYRASQPCWLGDDLHAVIPFAALERDFEVARDAGRRQPGPRELVSIKYVGAGGAIMARSFRLICRTLAELRRRGDPLVERLRIELLGTAFAWQEGFPKPLEAIAAEESVGDLVREVPRRVPYRESLEIALAADGLLILGVDDAGYMPSKLFSYALSGKPLLASVRRDSPAFQHVQRLPSAHALCFDARGEMPQEAAVAEFAGFIAEAAARITFDRKAAIEPQLAPAMAAQHAALFSRVVAAS